MLREAAWTSCRPTTRNRQEMAKGQKRKMASGDVASNRQASFRYNLLERFECGMVLEGTEVKSLRQGGAQLKDSYAAIRDGEVWLFGVYIAPYAPAARENHDPERPRKLLLHRREIERLIGASTEKGLTIVPTRIYFAPGRAGGGTRAKIEIAVARGKDLYDKRQSIKTRDMQREVQRELREVGR
jgi:SsrA-binding protein